MDILEGELDTVVHVVNWVVVMAMVLVTEVVVDIEVIDLFGFKNEGIILNIFSCSELVTIEEVLVDIFARLEGCWYFKDLPPNIEEEESSPSNDEPEVEDNGLRLFLVATKDEEDEDEPLLVPPVLLEDNVFFFFNVVKFEVSRDESKRLEVATSKLRLLPDRVGGLVVITAMVVTLELVLLAAVESTVLLVDVITFMFLMPPPDFFITFFIIFSPFQVPWLDWSLSIVLMLSLLFG